MKNAVVCLFLLGLFAPGQAQVVQLEEAKVKYTPEAVIVKNGVSAFQMKIAESYAGQFENNPLKFVKENFAIQELIKETKRAKYDSYFVTFKSKKGYLEAEYNKKGNLVRTSQKFHNIKIPVQMRKDLIADHKGWNMKKNSYVASGNKDLLDKEVYRITLTDGKKNKSIKIKNDLKESRRLASRN